MHRRHDEDVDRLVSTRHYLDTEQGSGSDQLTKHTDQGQADGKSKAHADTIK